jgi:putative two-component system response regulator
VEETIATMRRDSGTHFDPELIELFIAELPAILAIKEQWREPA